MIIDVREILNTVDEARKNNKDYSFEMEFKDGMYRPTLKKENTISIPPTRGDKELVGLAIVERLNDPVNGRVLCSNGILVDGTRYVRPSEVLIFTSYADAKIALDAMYNKPGVVKCVHGVTETHNFGIYAVYQRQGSNDMEIIRL